MESLTRKSLLNKSALGFLCVNHVQGCSHGCLYPCYAFSMARSYGRVKTYEEWTRPRIVGNARELLGKELGRLKELPPSVHLSLTTDPFMHGQPEVEALTLDLVALINARGIPVSILTKGVLPAALADTSRYRADNVYGISIVSLSEDFRARWEPGAAPFAERLASLLRLHEAGLRTRAHVEPYPTPNIFAQDPGEVLEALSFVDSLYFGGWNYSPLTRKFPDAPAFYEATRGLAARFCSGHAISFEG